MEPASAPHREIRRPESKPLKIPHPMDHSSNDCIGFGFIKIMPVDGQGQYQIVIDALVCPQGPVLEAKEQTDRNSSSSRRFRLFIFFPRYNTDP